MPFFSALSAIGRTPLTGRTAPFTLAAGSADVSQDAGLYRPAQIGDLTWVDTNANGQKDAGETGLADVVVRLYNASDAVMAVTTSSVAGAYSFANLPDTAVIPPNYNPPAGAVITKPASGPITSSTPSTTPSPSGTQPNVAPVIVNPSTTSNGADINYEKKLQDLKSLLDKGLINKQDYELKKNEILKGM